MWLLQVIESHGEDFSEVNVATAFHELAKAAEGKDLQDVHVHDTFQTLVGETTFCSTNSPRQSKISWLM